VKLLILSKYGRLGASSRLRSYQYVPFLRARGHVVTLAPLLGDDYVQQLYSDRVSRALVASAYARRIATMLLTNRYDVVWAEKEMLPWLPSWVERLLLRGRTRLVLDYDDAVFHRYDCHPSALVRATLGRKIDRLMRCAHVVVVGNAYLGDRARRAGANRVELLPTAVDTVRYAMAASKERLEPAVKTVGWIGSPSTAKHLRMLAPVVREVATSGVRFVAVGPNPDQVADLPIEVRPWAEDTEVEEISKFDVGVMPLPDHPFERGKCGYKLVQYMACGKPVVASPVGANAEIVRDGIDGVLARDEEEWKRALIALLGDSELRLRMGRAGRERMEQEYSSAVVAPRLERILRACAGDGPRPNAESP
jgi:glycosyltransferase involved in cell wall biosynthesis